MTAEGFVSVGGDVGLKSDSTACAVVRTVRGIHHVVDLMEIRPKRGEVLAPSIVGQRFAAMMKMHGATTMMADQHYLESIREDLGKHGLFLQSAPAGQNGKAESYVIARMLFNERKVLLEPHPHRARLVAQGKAIISKPTAGGGIAISSPRRAGGGHGDLWSALVLALWSAHTRTAYSYAPMTQRITSRAYQALGEASRNPLDTARVDNASGTVVIGGPAVREGSIAGNWGGF